MARMTNALRDAIVGKALEKSGYTAARAAYTERKAAWSEAVRIDALGMPEAEILELEKKAKELYAKIPAGLRCNEGGLYRRETLQLTVAGQRDTAYFKEAVSNWKHTLDADHPLAVEREHLINENRRLEKWHLDVRDPVRAAVNSVSTVAALLKAWPESKELIPEHVAEAKPQLPAIQVADLNALVGLPTE